MRLEIITPDGIAWENGSVDSAVIPTESGEIEILPGHIPLISILKAGSAIAKFDGKEEVLAVDRGFVRCSGDSVTLLTEAAININEISENEVEKARKAAEEALEKAKRGRNSDQMEIDRLESISRFLIAQQLTKERFKNK